MSYGAYAFALRNYFESGCACIANGELKQLGTEVSDDVAAKHYVEHCKCSRNDEDFKK